MNNDPLYRVKAEKPAFSLIPPGAEEEVAKVFSHGAEKYGRNDWWKIEDPHVFIGAARRHINAVQQGELADKESGLAHLAHAICNLQMLLENQLEKPAYMDLLYEVEESENA